ncbi:MAG: hypothetical protein N2115_02400, partial [bacterium]|nr:hypothetical protein [bacterium]
WVWNIIKKHGKIPLFWADMFFTENCPHLLKQIDKGVIPVIWEYDDTDKITPEISIGGLKPTILEAKNSYRTVIRDLPFSRMEREGNFFEDLDEKIKEMIGTDSKTGYPHSFPQTRIASQFRKNFWSACAVYTCSDMLFLPSFIRGVLNPVFMCNILKKVNCKGIIATNWAKAHSFAPISPPWTLALYNIAHFAAVSYTGRTQPSEIKENSKIVAREIGIPIKFGQFYLDDILWTISSNAPGPGIIRRVKNLENVLLLLKQQKVDGIFGKGLLISVEAELLWSKLQFLQEEARWWTPNRKEVPSIVFKEMSERFRNIVKEIHNLEKKAGLYYAQFVGDKKSFRAWWKGLFEFDLNITEKSIKFLAKN